MAAAATPAARPHLRMAAQNRASVPKVHIMKPASIGSMAKGTARSSAGGGYPHICSVNALPNSPRTKAA